MSALLWVAVALGATSALLGVLAVVAARRDKNTSPRAASLLFASFAGTSLAVVFPAAHLLQSTRGLAGSGVGGAVLVASDAMWGLVVLVVLVAALGPGLGTAATLVLRWTRSDAPRAGATLGAVAVVVGLWAMSASVWFWMADLVTIASAMLREPGTAILIPPLPWQALISWAVPVILGAGAIGATGPRDDARCPPWVLVVTGALVVASAVLLAHFARV